MGGATVHGWPEELRLMVDNLLANAALHGREDGRVEVQLDAHEDALLLRIDDDGPGVPNGEREVVLEPFRRGWSPRSEGTGLGLAIVAQQASLHGGTITLTTSPLGGLRVTCTLAR
ncbi:MAG: ATP-binding protein [Solirubrobacteraceae bacterium]